MFLTLVAGPASHFFLRGPDLSQVLPAGDKGAPFLDGAVPVSGHDIQIALFTGQFPGAADAVYFRNCGIGMLVGQDIFSGQKSVKQLLVLISLH